MNPQDHARWPAVRRFAPIMREAKQQRFFVPYRSSARGHFGIDKKYPCPSYVMPDIWGGPIFYFSRLRAARVVCNSFLFFASTVG
jgi:hypothetical protein